MNDKKKETKSTVKQEPNDAINEAAKRREKLQKEALERNKKLEQEREQKQMERAPIEAVNKMHDILKPLPLEERVRVISSVKILLGMEDK